MGYDYRKFEKLCENKGIKPSTVSRATGVSTATLSSWKGGKYIPKADKIQLIANYFGVNLDYFSDDQTNSGGGYYTDADTAKIAQEIFENKDLRILFDAAADARPQDLQMAAEMLRRFKETNPNG
jgi:transcriptional regulator with XRE-family HTH domain